MLRSARIPFVSSLLAVCTIVSACASTNLVDVWVDEARTGTPIEKLLVVAVSQQDRDRRIFEDRMVSEIRSRGRSATASYSIVPTGSEEVGQDGISKAAREGAFDAVLVSRYAGSEERTVYVPGRTRTEVRGDGRGYRHIDDFYWRSWETVHEPGFEETFTTVLLETNVYSVDDGSLIWSARSETFNPESTSALIEELSRQIASSLEGNGLL